MIEITGKDLNNLGYLLNQYDGEKTLISKMFEDNYLKYIVNNLSHIKEILADWTIETLEEEWYLRHDDDIYDTGFIFKSPNGSETKIEHKTCLMVGWNFENNKIFKLNT